MLDGPDRSLTRPAAEPVSKLWMSSLGLTFTKSKPSTARSATHFSMSAYHISSKGPQLQFDRHEQTSFENNFFRPTGEWVKRCQRHGSVQPQTSWISSGLACFFFSLCKPSQSMRMVLAIRLFQFRSRKAICSMYAKLLRCTVYACEAALALGEPQESGETPRISQSASSIFLVNARPFPEQSSSIATCCVGSIKRGKGLVRG